MATATFQNGLVTTYVPPKTNTVSSVPQSPRKSGIPPSLLYAAADTNPGQVVLHVPTTTPKATPTTTPKVSVAKKAEADSCMEPCVQCFACLGGTGGLVFAIYAGVVWLQPALYKALESNPGVNADAGSKGITAVIELCGGIETAVSVGAASFALLAACAWCCTASCRDE